MEGRAEATAWDAADLPGHLGCSVRRVLTLLAAMLLVPAATTAPVEPWGHASGDLAVGRQQTWYEGRTVALTSVRGHVTWERARLEAGVLGPEYAHPVWMVRAGYDGVYGGVVAGLTLFPFVTTTMCSDGDCSDTSVTMIPFPTLGIRMGPAVGIHARAGFFEVTDGGLAILRGGLATSDPAIGTLEIGMTADLASGSGPFVQLELHGGKPVFARATATLGNNPVAAEKGPSFALAVGARF